jgi:anti-sigma B factor antagonist
MLTFDRKDQNGVTILQLGGNLDALTAPGLKKEIEALISDRRAHIVFALDGLDLIDSSGVGAIVSLFKRARTIGGDVKLAGLRGQPREIFKLLRLDRAFELFDSVDEAIARFAP